MKNAIQEEIRGIFAFVAILWGVYLLDFITPIDLTDWGLAPRSLWGLAGIPLAPFLHASFSHLLGNSIPLIVLLVLLSGSRQRTWATLCEITLLGGVLLWLFGRATSQIEGEGIIHVGASGLIYGLIAFLIVAGFREKRLASMLVALLVGFLYGGTLLTGVLPSIGANVSWDGHLFGAVAGIIVAWISTQPSTETDAEPLPQP